jgi:hypothetical protein
MQVYADPLGIERIIAETQAELDATTPTQDQFDNWNQHPITIRMKKALAVELYRRQQEYSITPNPDLVIAMQQIINYGIADGVEE